MRARLAGLVTAVAAAAARRSDPLHEGPVGTGPRLAEVVAVLQGDHPAGTGETGGAWGSDDTDSHGTDPSGADPSETDSDRVALLAAVVGLSRLDEDLLVVAAAADLDVNLSTAYAVLQGDPARRRPSVALALELCGAGTLSAPARARLAPGAPLLRHRLLEVVGDGPLLDRALRVPDRVVAHLLGDDAPHPLTGALRVEPEPSRLPGTALLAAALRDGTPLCWVRAPAGSAGLSLAASALLEAGVLPLAVDLRHRPAGVDLRRTLEVICRDGALLRRIPVLVGAEAVPEADPALLRVLEEAAVPVVAVADRPWDPAWPAVPVVVEAAPVPPDERDRLWRALAGVQPDDGGDRAAWSDLVALRLTPEEIVASVGAADQWARLRDEEPRLAHLRDAARTQGGGGLRGVARRAASTSRAGFDDLVLPPATLTVLHELVSWARHRDAVLSQGALAGKGGKGRGIAALFSGSPGTGKTLAAQVVATELGLDLQTVDLSAVVDKYIGETEKNLERVFAQAEALNCVLFFDEADALFGSRSEVRDARDRYANQEVSYLLQRMEQFDGIAVLASNLRGNLDPAFSRRLHFIIHFPDPDGPTRRRLWEGHLAELSGTDADDEPDLDRLSADVELAGGDIRNIVLAAAYAAAEDASPVGMRHLAAATVREFRKLGRRLPDGLVDP